MFFEENKIKNYKTLRKEIFWDSDYDNIDYEKEKNFIVSRVLDYGNIEDYYALFNIYGGIDKVKAIIQNLKFIAKDNIPFLEMTLGIKAKDLRCLNTK